MTCFNGVLIYSYYNFVRNYDFKVSRLSQLFGSLEERGDC